MKKLLAAATLVGLILLGHSTAYAVPILQLYIEGATYDETTETWVYVPEDPSTGVLGRLWAIGNTDGEGGQGDIIGVRLAIAYSVDDAGIQIELIPSTTGGYGGFTDPSESFPVPTQNTIIETTLGQFVGTEVTNGGGPVLSNGNALPTHGIYYGPGTVWQEFSLGNFTLTDSPVADFIDSFPAPGAPNEGQINVYEVSVANWSGEELHFDLYDAIQAKNRAKFAPFSHDAEVSPEPASFIIWFLIGLTWAGRGWAYQYWHRWRQWEREETAVAANMGGRRQSGAAVRSADAIESRFKTGPAGGAAIGRARRHSSF